MASAASSCDLSTDNSEVKHLELFTLIWLDDNKEFQDNRATEQKLRRIINHFLYFHDLKSFQDYMRQVSTDDRLIMIVNGKLGRIIVPEIHGNQQVLAIFIYCIDIDSHKKWFSSFSKVNDVLNDIDILIERLREYHKYEKKIEEPLLFVSFQGESTSGINGQFVFFQTLIDCLLRMKSNQRDHDELISFFKKEYDGNLGELEYINQLDTCYCANDAINWYTRECFFYKTLNGALRKRDIHMMFLFRQYMKDIYEQLKNYQKLDSLKVYRGQFISLDELEHLKKLVGKIISINSFFSTSVNRFEALSFLRNNDSKTLACVLFEIDVQIAGINSKPFADIRSLSAISGESEVLFMFGSIFRIEIVQPDINDTSIWIINLKLLDDNENQLSQVIKNMKKQNGTGAANLQTLGRLLSNMGQSELALKYYHRFLDELPEIDERRIDIYNDLGSLAGRNGALDESIKWHKKAIALKADLCLDRLPSLQSIPSNKIKPKVVGHRHNKKQSCLVNHDVEIMWRFKGTERPKVTWFFNGKQLEDCDRIRFMDDEDEGSILIIKKVQPTDEGSYTARAINSMGEAEAQTELLVLNERVKIIVELPSTITVNESQAIFLMLVLTTDIESKVIWMKADNMINNSERIKCWSYCINNQVYSKLKIRNCQRNDAGKYWAKVKTATDSYSSIECQVNINATNQKSFLPKVFSSTKNPRLEINLPYIGGLNNVPSNARWSSNGKLVTDRVSDGIGGLAIDRRSGTVYIADTRKNRVVSWSPSEHSTRAVVQNLNCPTNILIDTKTDSIIIADRDSRRVLRSSLIVGQAQNVSIIDNIDCCGLAMDDAGFLYVTDVQKHEVRRYSDGDKNGVIVAGGNGRGSGLHQLSNPISVTVDNEGSVYVSDKDNNRVVKWIQEAREGIIVVGLGGRGSNVTQLSYPQSIIVDANDNLYIVDHFNNRVLRYRENTKKCDIIIDSNRLERPVSIALDSENNFYIACVGRIFHFFITD